MSDSNFDRIAEVYDDSLPSHVVDHYLEKRTRFVVEHCPRGTALDVGCGTGALAARLADAGYEMTGVDPSEGMLGVLEQRARRSVACGGRARRSSFRTTASTSSTAWRSCTTSRQPRTCG